MEDLAAWIITRFVIAAFFAGIATAAFYLFCNIFIMPFTRNSGIKKAKEEGRVITGTFISMVSPNINGYSNWETGVHMTTSAKYRYEHNGKKYVYKGNFSEQPPHEIQLLYRKDPAKARRAQEYASLESEWKLIFPVLTGIGFVVTFFFF